MATVATPVAEICSAAKRASRLLARVDSDVKDAALEAIAAALESRTEEILEANERDMQSGREDEIGDALLDRLRLDEQRIVREVRQQPQLDLRIVRRKQHVARFRDECGTNAAPQFCANGNILQVGTG